MHSSTRFLINSTDCFVPRNDDVKKGISEKIKKNYMKQTILLLITIFTFSCTPKKKTAKPQLKSEIEKITNGKNATVAVSVLDFETGKSINVNGNKKLPMLSVFKFHIALAVLEQVDQGKLDLNQKILIKRSELLENTWSPIREKYPNGNVELPLSEIIKYTVAQSDNNGCDVLLRLIGGTVTVQNFMNEKEVKDFQIKFNEEDMTYQNMVENYSSSKSIVQLLHKFYQNKIVSKTSTDFLMKVMLETTTGENKLIAGLPKNTPTAHKTGSSGKNDDGLTIAENDMGIITLPNGNHYAICIFVINSTETKEVNEKTVADISKLTFEHLNSSH